MLSQKHKNHPFGWHLLISLVHEEWDETHEAGALDRFGEHALVLGREARPLARKDAAVWVQEALQIIDIFIVDKPNVICVKIIVFHIVRLQVKGNRF